MKWNDGRSLMIRLLGAWGLGGGGWESEQVGEGIKKKIS